MMDALESTKLVEAALLAREKAYAPYSNYSVGSAVLTDDGEIFVGCNVENASFGLTNCAERAAIYNAIAHGKRNFRALALVLQKDGVPCGACRQVMNEFNPNLEIVIANPDGKIVQRTSLEALLPQAFGPNNLEL